MQRRQEAQRHLQALDVEVAVQSDQFAGADVTELSEAAPGARGHAHRNGSLDRGHSAM
jgi:hypothetical protein